MLLVVHSAKLAGAQIVAAGQAEALAQDRPLIVSVGPGPLRPRFEQVATVVRQPTRLPVWGASRGRWAIELARVLPDAVRLAWIARRQRAGVIVAGSTVLAAPVVAARLAGVPSVVIAHEAPKSAAARRLFRFHGALADVVVAISPMTAEAFGACRARVILNPVGIDLPPWSPRPPRATGDPLRLLVIGTLDRHKRQDLAVAALALLRDEGTDATLELLGAEGDPAFAGDLRAAVEAAGLTDRVSFTGLRRDVPDRLRGADVLLVPGGEVTPLVIMEAMAHGTPVVAAAMGSIPDVVGDGESGLLVAPESPRDLADGVARIALDPELAAALRAGGRDRVERDFDQRSSNDRLREEIAGLLGEGA